MTEHFHAIVWIDHREAKIFHFSEDDIDKVVIPSHATGHHLHHKANTTGSGHLGIDKEFFERVITALTHTGAILITGPANAKTELKNYLEQHRPELAKRVSGVEPLDHPSDGQLVSLARKFFKADDRMRAQ
jgi:stalled ribosome rescue protein Dom34